MLGMIGLPAFRKARKRELSTDDTDVQRIRVDKNRSGPGIGADGDRREIFLSVSSASSVDNRSRLSLSL